MKSANSQEFLTVKRYSQQQATKFSQDNQKLHKLEN